MHLTGKQDPSGCAARKRAQGQKADTSSQALWKMITATRRMGRQLQGWKGGLVGRIDEELDKNDSEALSRTGYSYVKQYQYFSMPHVSRLVCGGHGPVMCIKPTGRAPTEATDTVRVQCILLACDSAGCGIHLCSLPFSLSLVPCVRTPVLFVH